MSTNTLNDVRLIDGENQRAAFKYNKVQIDFDSNVWSYVYNFFRKSTVDPTAAETLALSVYKIAAQTRVSPLTIVQSMEGQDGIKLNTTMSYYMNGIRSNATLIGVETAKKPNFYAGRSVLS